MYVEMSFKPNMIAQIFSVLECKAIVLSSIRSLGKLQSVHYVECIEMIGVIENRNLIIVTF